VTAAPVDLLGYPDAWSAKRLLRKQFHVAHALLDDAIDRLPIEAVHRCAFGTNVSSGVRYAQVVLCEDLSVNGVLAAGTPLVFSTWAGRTGLNEMPPIIGTPDWRAWAHRVRLDLAQLRPYARAVYASTDAYIAALPQDAFIRRGGIDRRACSARSCSPCRCGPARSPACWRSSGGRLSMTTGSATHTLR
jgi:hypothetical protein